MNDDRAGKTSRTDWAWRTALIVLGVAAILRGASLILFGMGPSRWLAIAIYLAAGSAVHDLLIAPTSLLFGRILRRQLRVPVAGNAIRGAWLGTGTVLLIGLPLVIGARQRSNPTVIPGRPLLNVGLSLALLIAGATVVIVLSRIPAFRRSTTATTAP
jgi:hypothetical protein